MSDTESPQSSALGDGIWDVIAFRESYPNQYVGPDSLSRQQDLQGLEGGFSIGADAIGRAVASACKPRGLAADEDRVFLPHLVLARKVSDSVSVDSNYWIFDRPMRGDGTGDPKRDHPMHTAVRLLRIVRAHHIGYGLAGRVVMQSGLADRIYPNELVGAGGFGFVHPSPKQDSLGLRSTDLDCFNQLWSAYSTYVVPERVEEAIVWFERASWEQSARTRVPLMVTAAECLLTVDDYNTTRQFVLRMEALVKRGIVSEECWNGVDLAAIYKLRSALVHGRQVEPGDSKTCVERLLGQLEEALRQVLRSSIIDRSVAALFESDSMVESELPADKVHYAKWWDARRSLPLPSWMSNAERSP